MQDKEIILSLDPCKGQLRLNSLTAVVGDCVGALPEPVRKGYVFAGWYTSPEDTPESKASRVTPSTLVTEDFSTILYARWETPDKAAARQKKTKKTALRTQKKALVALAVAVAILIAALAVVEYIVDIYHYTDTDGITYTIKKSDGVYGLYYDGVLCDISTVNNTKYYITRFGNEIYVDPETGECEVYAVVDVEGTEEVGAGRHVLMFKQLTYDQSSTKDASRVLQKIQVHNQHGDMTFVRGDNNRFYIQGHESTMFSEQLFAQLSVGCGYTISSQRLKNPVLLSDGSIDLTEYGLAPEQREREVADETNENGEVKTEVYDYVPTRYTLTTMTGDTYTVTIGDATVSGSGYYAMYEDRQTIYILSSTNLAAAALQPIETLVTPMMVYPMSVNTYYDVENFTYRSNIDYDAIYRDIVLELTGFDINAAEKDPETGEFTQEVTQALKDVAEQMEAMDEKTLDAFYDPIFKKHSKVVTAFTFVDTASRENTMMAAFPYQMASEYMAGYLPNTDTISDVLHSFYQASFNGVMKLGPSDEDLEKYGLDEPAHVISFIYHEHVKQSDGTTDVINHQNYVEISQKNADNVYYAYSPYFDMIVAFHESSMLFLEKEEIDWYDRDYFQNNIAYTQKIMIEGAGLENPIVFDLDNSKSDQSSGTNSEKLEIFANGKKVSYSLTVTSISGSQTTENEVFNFRRFYKSLLSASMEGVVSLTEDEMAALRDLPDSECLLKLTFHMDDGLGTENSTRYLVYRFYRYSERKAYMTVEVLDTPNSESVPQNGQGIFYVSQSFCQKIIADAERFLAGVEVITESKK